VLPASTARVRGARQALRKWPYKAVQTTLDFRYGQPG
jgi:hypothetical protein